MRTQAKVKVKIDEEDDQDLTDALLTLLKKQLELDKKLKALVVTVGE